MRKWKVGLLCALFVGAVSLPAQAAQIATGSTLIKSGNFIPVDAAGNPTTLDLATGFDFTEFTLGTAPTPGVDGDFLITQATGDFAGTGLLLSFGEVSDFMFTGAPIAGFPVAPIGSFEAAPTVGPILTVDLVSIAIDEQNAQFVNLVGTVIFNLQGFDPTPGMITITGTTTTGLTFGFAANQAADPSALPEPASMSLLGLGLLGIGVIRRRMAA